MQVNLVYFKEDGQSKSFSLDKPVSVLGRRVDCDLRIPLIGVSRQHCELLAKDGGVAVKDLDSSNGTFVNARRIQEQPLKPGDRLQVGPVLFTVQIDGAPEQISPPSEQADVEEVSDVEPVEDGGELDSDEDIFAQLVMGDSDLDDDAFVELDEDEEPGTS